MSQNTTRTNNGHDLQAINWVRDDVRGLTRDERLLLQYLAARCNSDGTHSCFPSVKEIKSDLECSRDLVMTLTKSLAAKNLISKKRRPNTSTLYTLHVIRKSVPEQLPEVGARTTSGSRYQNDHKERTGSKESEVKNQKKNSTAPSAGASQSTDDQQANGDQGLRLVEQYRRECMHNEKARIGFYMKCGRLHTDHDLFFRPKNPIAPLGPNQIKALNRWFEQLPDSGCDVMNYAMQNWSRLYAEIPAWRDFRNVNPLVSALEKYGEKELLGSWRQSQNEEMLRRVEARLAQENAA